MLPITSTDVCVEVLVVRNTVIPGARILYVGTCHLLVLSMEFASCASYGAFSCKVAARFFLIYAFWV